jgi:hypothetical protein
MTRKITQVILTIPDKQGQSWLVPCRGPATSFEKRRMDRLRVLIKLYGIDADIRFYGPNAQRNGYGNGCGKVRYYRPFRLGWDEMPFSLGSKTRWFQCVQELEFWVATHMLTSVD